MERAKKFTKTKCTISAYNDARLHDNAYFRLMFTSYNAPPLDAYSLTRYLTVLKHEEERQILLKEREELKEAFTEHEKLEAAKNLRKKEVNNPLFS